MRTMSSALAIGALIAAMGTDSAATMANNAEFHSLKECLAGIQKNSKQSLRIVTDRPDEVSGLLANGQGFACEKVTSGTKGVYYKGWYMSDD